MHNCNDLLFKENGFAADALTTRLVKRSSSFMKDQIQLEQSKEGFIGFNLSSQIKRATELKLGTEPFYNMGHERQLVWLKNIDK